MTSQDAEPLVFGPETAGISHAANGFTLLEALVVMAVVALIAGLGWPSLERAGAALAWRQTRAAVEAALDGAHAACLRRGHAVVLTAAAANGAPRLDLDAQPWLVLPPGTTLALRPERITFNPDGSATPAVLVLSGSGGRSRFVVDPLAGRITRDDAPLASSGNEPSDAR